MELKHTRIECPHCGHSMHLELDPSNGDQDYHEECPNCHEMIHVVLHKDDLLRRLDVKVSADDEQVY